VRRSNADKRFAVLRLVKDAEWGGNSLRWIAEEAGVSHDLVRRVKDELQLDDSSSSHIRTTGKDGKVRPASRQKPASASGDRSTKNRNADIEDEAELWAIRHQLARRNLSPHDCKLFIWRLYNASKKDVGRPTNKLDQNEPITTGEPVGDPDEDVPFEELLPGDNAMEKLSAVAEKEYRKARSALGVLVRYFAAKEIDDEGLLDRIGSLIG
jgi:hypothetical protein